MKNIFLLLFLAVSISSQSQTPNLHWKYQDDGKSYFEDRGKCIAFDNAGNSIVAGYVESGCTETEIFVVKYNQQGDTLWKVNYDGSGTTTQEDEPTAITIDASNNIYVTGRSEENAFFYAVTLKIDPSGTLMWDQRYLSAESEANDIAVDGSGNVYICGYKKQNSNKDYLVIKYNSSGSQQWEQNYSNGNYDEAIALKTDATGNVYVTGKQSGVNAFYDWATIKYNASGVQQWIDVFSNPTLVFSEEPVDLVLDSAGAIYVTGNAAISSISNRDIYTIKYDTAGNRIWETPYHFSGYDGDEYPVEMIVDNGGNVFITGNIVSTTGGQDICTIKLNAFGEFVWENNIDSIQQTDYANSIVLDPSGDFIYISAGVAVPPAGFINRDILIVKMDTSGTEIHRSVLNGPGNNFDLPLDLAVDASGKVAVTGMQSMNVSGTANGDAATFCFDSQLNTLWTKYINGDGFTDDQGADMVVDAAGNSYVCGFTRSGDIMYEDLVVFKVNASGQRVWEFIYEGTEETSSEIAVAIAVDAQQNVFVTGTTDTSTGTNYRNIYTAKLDANGLLIWENIYNGSAGGADVPVAIGLDAAGNVYVGATTVNTGTGFDATLICYSPSGTLAWSTSVDKGGQAETCSAMIIDNQQNIYAAGAFLPASGAQSDGLLVKFNSSGTVVWDTVYDYSAATNDLDFFNSIALDNAGNIFVAGQSNQNFVAAKYDPSGIPLWIQNYSYSNFVDSACAIAVDVNGDVLVAGTFGQPVEADFGVVKYKNDGTLIWDMKYNNSAGSDDIVTDMAVDSIGNIYLTGWETSTYTTNYNFMTLKYDSAGTFKYELIWSSTNGVEPDYGKRIGLDANGNIYMMGDANENCFGNSFVNGFRWNTQVIRYGQGIFVGENDLQLSENAMMLYPNPASSELSIALPESLFGNSPVEIFMYDLQGKLLFSEKLNSGEIHTLNIEHFASGMVFYIARNEYHQHSGKIIINKN